MGQEWNADEELEVEGEVLEEEEEEEEVDDEESAPAGNPMSTSSLAKGSEVRQQWSHTKSISPPSLTHLSYLASVTETEHRTCVHLLHRSHSMALLALVTPFAQATHG